LGEFAKQIASFGELTKQIKTLLRNYLRLSKSEIANLPGCQARQEGGTIGHKAFQGVACLQLFGSRFLYSDLCRANSDEEIKLRGFYSL
jgi:hypothetical protein